MLDEDEEELSAYTDEDTGDRTGSTLDDDDFGEETSDEIEAPEAGEDVDAALNKAVVGDNGLIYVGDPPKEDAPFVLAGPLALIRDWISKLVQKNRQTTDLTLPGADHTTFPARRLELTSCLEKSLIQHGEDRFGLICDYTGMDMSWSPGSRKRSLEAFYPFILRDGQIGYHEGVNVGFITAHLNWTKMQSPPTVLPLLAHMLRAAQEPDLQARKRTMTWGYIALRNVCIAGNVLGCHGHSHRSKAALWAQWDKSKLNQVLEELRTAKRGPATQEELENWTPLQLLGRHEVGWLGGPNTYRLPEDFSSWGVVYKWLRKVAKSYELTHDEFRYYCTAASPSDSPQRVFYPFHVLTRPEAEELKWDWGVLYNTAYTKLRIMKRSCNRHAEKAGYGEPKLDALRLIVWWCHVLCRKIQKVKAERPTATREEIAFSIVDRWGLPIVPWVHNPLRASLCKKQDHSIAMVSGLAWPDDEEFDPVKHFDLDRSTMTIDTKGTNLAMLNFATSSWAGIRETLMAVPLSHPLWQIDPAVGLAGWVGAWHGKLPTPQPPVLPFNIPLQPIDPWMDSNIPMQPIRCTECPDMPVFQTIGLLVRHCRTDHAGEDSNTFPASRGGPSAEQIKVEEEFWNLKCPHCGNEFASRQSLAAHLSKWCGRPESGTKPRFPCSMCPESFWTKKDRVNHLVTIHGQGLYSCEVDGCDAVFNNRDAVYHHRRYMHDIRLLECRVKGCPYKLGSQNEIQDHILKHHGDVAFKCPVEGCGQVFIGQELLTRHTGEIHGIGCEHCGELFRTRTDLKRHIKAVHLNKRYKCTVENCNEIFTSRSAREIHMRRVHSLGLFKCRKGCSESFVLRSQRDAHETKQHPDTQE
jgi:uncharacterized C2H2 Zn-finger protein